MKKLLSILATIGVCVTTSVNVVACGEVNNMVDIKTEQGDYITTIDKTQVEKYTLYESSNITGTAIVFYFKDGTFDNCRNKPHYGTLDYFKPYLTNLLGFGPTPFNELGNA